jgi:hypothetical protein
MTDLVPHDRIGNVISKLEALKAANVNTTFLPPWADNEYFQNLHLAIEMTNNADTQIQDPEITDKKAVLIKKDTRTQDPDLPDKETVLTKWGQNLNWSPLDIDSSQLQEQTEPHNAGEETLETKDKCEQSYMYLQKSEVDCFLQDEFVCSVLRLPRIQF